MSEHEQMWHVKDNPNDTWYRYRIYDGDRLVANIPRSGSSGAVAGQIVNDHNALTAARSDRGVLAQRVRYLERMNYAAQRRIRGMEERGAAMQPGDTARLMCAVTGAFCGLVRVVSVSDGPCTVVAETPILDWLTTGERGEYPYQTWSVGHRFNAERNELRVILAPAAGVAEGTASDDAK